MDEQINKLEFEFLLELYCLYLPVQVCCGPGDVDIAGVVDLKVVPAEEPCQDEDSSKVHSLPPEVKEIKAEVPRPEPPPDYEPRCGR